MKTRKILSIVLVLAMALSLSATAFASNTTTFSYTGAEEESYTVTVPATLNPGSNGNVVLEGTWPSNRVVTITADSTVTLTNSISGADQKVLDVAFDGIELVGNNTQAISTNKTISVENIENALFGIWSGTFYYQVFIDSIQDDIKSETKITDLTGYTWVGNSTMIFPGCEPNEAEDTAAPEAEEAAAPETESINDLTGKNTDQMDFINTRTPVLDAVDNKLIVQNPTLGADVPGQAGAAGDVAEGGAQELGPNGENPRPTPEKPEPMCATTLTYNVDYIGTNYSGNEFIGSSITFGFDPFYPLPPTQDAFDAHCPLYFILVDDVVNTMGSLYANSMTTSMSKSVYEPASDAITFTGGEDATNAYLIAWLQSNGTLSK